MVICFQLLVLSVLHPVLILVKTMDHHLVVVQCDVEGVDEVVTEYRMVAGVVVVVTVVVIKMSQTFVVSVYIFFHFFPPFFFH
jgi:hypothetical protein